MKVSVCCRVRPVSSNNNNNINSNNSENCCLTSNDGKSINILSNGLVFPLDQVFANNESQETIFADIVSPLVTEAMRGVNCTLFSYGQTGSGKTYSLLGATATNNCNNNIRSMNFPKGNGSKVNDNDNDNMLEADQGDINRGIIPRTAEMIFKLLEKDTNSNNSCEMKLSVMEIYKEKLFDLLASPTSLNPSSTQTASSSSSSNSSHLRIREQQGTGMGVWVEGLTESKINKITEFNDILAVALKKRTTASHSMNAQSSRSHLCVIISLRQIQMQQPQLQQQQQQQHGGGGGGGGKKIFSKIHLIDLAGSEMVRKTDATGTRLDEAKHINKSLSALGKVIFALATQQQQQQPQSSSQTQLQKLPHIPFRDSKLTRLLQDSLGGNSRTVLVLAVSASKQHLQESISTLKFGERARQLKTRPQVNAEVDDQSLRKALMHAKTQIVALNATIAELQEQLQMSLKSSVDNNNNNMTNGTLSSLCQMCNGLVLLSEPMMKQTTNNKSNKNRKEKEKEREKQMTSKKKSSSTLFPSIAPAFAVASMVTVVKDPLPQMNKAPLISTSSPPRPPESRDKEKVNVIDNDGGDADADADDDDDDEGVSARCAVCGLDEESSDQLQRETGEVLGEMFTCDGNCGYRFHARCVGLLGEGGQYSAPEGEWLCSHCTCAAAGVDDDPFSSMGLEMASSAMSVNRSSVGLLQSSVEISNENNSFPMTNDNNNNNNNNNEKGVLANLKAEYHIMRRERNRVLLQWQQEKRITAILDERRQQAERKRDEELVHAAEEVLVLRRELDASKAECERMRKLSEAYLSSSNHNNQFASTPSRRRKGAGLDEDEDDGVSLRSGSVSSSFDRINAILSTTTTTTATHSQSNHNNNRNSFQLEVDSYSSSTRRSSNNENEDEEGRSASGSGSGSGSGGGRGDEANSAHVAIPKPWKHIKKNNKGASLNAIPSNSVTSSATVANSSSSNNSNNFSNGLHYPAPTLSSTPTKLKKYVSSFDSGNDDDNNIDKEGRNGNEDEDNGDEQTKRYLNPFKSRLQELLKSVNEETGSIVEIREKHRSRIDGSRKHLLTSTL